MRLGADLTEQEREAVAAWLEYSVGWSRDDILIEFDAEPALPGSVKLTYTRLLRNAFGKFYRINEGFDLAVEPFTIYASDNLGWLARYLERTNRVLA